MECNRELMKKIAKDSESHEPEISTSHLLGLIPYTYSTRFKCDLLGLNHNYVPTPHTQLAFGLLA